MSDDRDLLLLREQSWRVWFPQTDNVDELLEGFASFCAECVWIKHPKGRRLLALREAQIETARNMVAGNSLIVLKARQNGFSTLLAVYSLWQAIRRQDFTVLMLSRGEREAQELLDKAIYTYEQLAPWIKARAPARTTDNILKQAFANGSVLHSLPSKKDAARGYTGSLLIADEFAFLENPGEAWSSMEPAADIGGQIMVLTTANGGGTLFEEMWNNAYTGVRGALKPLFWSWREVKERNDEWYADKKATMQEHILHQEYPSNPEEAFVRSGRAVFDLDRLSEMHEEHAQRGFVLNGHFVHQGDGEMWVWEHPIEDHEYVMGIDTAEGLEHGDACSLFVIDGRTDHIVAHVWAHQPVDTWAQTCIDVGKFYNEALMVPEINNHGAAVLLYLTQQKYRRIIKMKHYGKRRPTDSKQLGFRTSVATKPIIIDGLYTFLRTHNVPHLFTVRELRTFVRDEKGKMGGSPNDDRVMSLAFTVEGLQYLYMEEYAQTLKPRKGTLAYYEAEWDRMGKGANGIHRQKNLVRVG